MALEKQLIESLLPFARQLQTVLNRTAYGAMIAISLLLIVHVLGSIVFHLLVIRCCRKYRSSTAGQFSVPSDDKLAVCTNALSITTEASFLCGSRTNTLQFVTVPTANVQDFKYSETKV